MKSTIKLLVLGLVLISSLFFINGCQNGTEIIETNEPSGDNSGGTTQTNTEPGVYNLKIGDSIKAFGKTVSLVDFNKNGETTISVDGKNLIIYSTNHKEIFQGLEITATKAEYGIELKDGQITFKIDPLELSSNQKLVYYDQTIVYKGASIKLVDVQADDTIILELTANYKSERVSLMEGITKSAAGISITNVDGFNRGRLVEEYAIIELE